VPPGLGYYTAGGYPWWPSAGTEVTPPEPGYLQVDAQPPDAKVYVDGLFLGNAHDLRREGGRRLDSGAHHVDVRSDGHETMSVDLRIDPRETTVYRTQLKPVTSAAAAPAPVIPAKPKAFYVIPGCYAGDTKPQAAQLPRGCDVANLRVVPPVISRVDAQRLGI
jgi:hypothetical protein